MTTKNDATSTNPTMVGRSTFGDRLHGRPPQPVEVEDGLGDDHTTEQATEVEPGGGDDRGQRGAQAVRRTTLPSRTPLARAVRM